MSFRVSSCGYALALVFGAGVSLLTARGQSRPSAAPQQTNLVRAAQPAVQPPKDRLKDLEDELSKALESFSPKGMLDKPEPQYQPPVQVIPNRRLKEERDKKNDWMLMQPDDLLQGNSMSDWLDPYATKDQKKKTDLDLFYERINQQRSLLNQKARLNPDDLVPLSNPGRLEDTSSDNDDKLPDVVKGPAGKLRDLLGGSSSTVTAPRNGLPELFGFNQNKLTLEHVQAHKNLMDQYRQVLAGSPPAVTPLSSTTVPGNSQNPVLPTSLPNSTPAIRPTTPGMVGSIYNPTIFPDHNATLLNQWNPLYAPPKVEPPKPAPIIDAPIEAPRRRF